MRWSRATFVERMSTRRGLLCWRAILTDRSRWINHELAAISREPGLFDAYAARWDALVGTAPQ